MAGSGEWKGPTPRAAVAPRHFENDCDKSLPDIIWSIFKFFVSAKKKRLKTLDTLIPSFTLLYGPV